MTDSIDKQTLMRRNNEALITLAVRKYGPVSRNELSRKTGLSVVSICKIVDKLISDSLLIESGTVAGPRGRPMSVLEINNNGDPIAGVLVSREIIETVVATRKCEFLARRTSTYNFHECTAESLISAIARDVERCIETAGLSGVDDVQGLGVAVCDQVDPFVGCISSFSPEPEWEGIPIGKMLSEQLNTQTYVDSDTISSALASVWLSDDAYGSSALYIMFSEGIAAAYVNQQNVIRGAHDTAAQIAHTIIDPNGLVCSCGNRGCLCAQTRDSAFLHWIWPELKAGQGDISVTKRKDLVQQGFRMAMNGHQQASNAFNTVTGYMGIAVANAISHFDPQTVFVYGTLIDIASHTVTGSNSKWKRCATCGHRRVEWKSEPLPTRPITFCAARRDSFFCSLTSDCRKIMPGHRY